MFYLVKLFVLMFITMVIENVVSRVRWKLVGRQTWFIVAISVCSLAFCVLGI